MMGRKQRITVFIHIKLAIRHSSLNWCAGKSSYILTLSYGLKGKATIIAFLWPAEILVASKVLESPSIPTSKPS